MELAPETSKTKKIYLIRHAESASNEEASKLAKEKSPDAAKMRWDLNLVDAYVTEKGLL